MQQRSKCWMLLISLVLFACGQPDTPRATSPTVTKPAATATMPAAQANPSRTPINGGQSSELSMIEQLQRPAQSQTYEFAPSPMSANINDRLSLFMQEFMLDQLMMLDLDSSSNPNDIPIQAIDDYLTDMPIDQVIAHYQTSFASTNWVAQPIQHINPQNAILMFEYEQARLYIFSFTPINTDQLFVSIKLLQTNDARPNLELPLVNTSDIFTAHDLHFPSDTAINNDLLNDSARGKLLKRDLLMPIRKLQSFWPGEITLEASLVAETSDSQQLTYNLAKAMAKLGGWQPSNNLLGNDNYFGPPLLRFVDNTIQVLLMNQLSEHEYLAQSSPNDWLLGMHLVTLRPADQPNFKLDPSFFSPIEALEIPTQPDQQDYQLGTDRLIDSLLYGWQHNQITKTKLQAYINTNSPAESACSPSTANPPSNIRYSVFSSDSNPIQVSATYKQTLTEPNNWHDLGDETTFAFYGVTTEQGYHGGTLNLIERSPYNPQLSGSIGIISESSPHSVPQISFRGQEYPYYIGVAWLVEPITHSLPLLTDTMVFNSVSHERFNGYVYGWLRSLNYQRSSNDCKEITYLDGVQALVINSSDLTVAPNFYDPILQSQGWQKIVMSDKHHRYIKPEQDGKRINTINIRWQLGSRIIGGIMQVVMIDSSVTHTQ